LFLLVENPKFMIEHTQIYELSATVSAMIGWFAVRKRPFAIFWHSQNPLNDKVKLVNRIY